MKRLCHICGSGMKKIVTDIPFKTSKGTIVIVKSIPVIQCDNCSDYLLEDAVMEHVDGMLSKINTKAELEIFQYAV